MTGLRPAAVVERPEAVVERPEAVAERLAAVAERPAPGAEGVAPRRPSAQARGSRTVDAVWVTGLLVVSLGAGWVLALHAGGVAHNRMLPWILARAFGLAAYATLCLLVAVGIWFRHPWRVNWRVPGAESVLRLHGALAVATICLLCVHVLATALDRYAGVGWIGAFVPWRAVYRPTAVALGTLALYGIVLVGGTAALAGSVARRVWLPIHSLAAALFGVCLLHGLLAGSDSRALWWMYVVSGFVVVVLQTTRTVARWTTSPDAS